jgi:HEAT repeat protein
MERSSPEIWNHLSEVEALGELRDARAVPALLKALKDEDDGTGTRAAACKALGKIGDPRALEPLRQMPNGESEESFNPAAEAITSILKRSSVSILTHYLTDKDTRYRTAALQALKSNGSEAALDVFLAHYKNADAAERLSIINGLYGIDNPRIKEALRDSLNDPEPRVRFYAVSRLISEYGARDIAPLLVPLISEPNIDQEMELLLRDALVKCKDPRTTEPLLKLLDNSIITAQTIAAAGLGAIKEQRAVPRLIELAEPAPGKSPDRYEGIRPDLYLRATAIRALGDIRDVEAVPILLATLREEQIVGAAAAQALGKCRDKRAVEPLILSLEDPLVSDAAAEALGMIGDRRAIEPLKKLQTDEMPNISILGALAKLGDRDALDQLFVIAKKNDRHYNSDVAAVHALGAVNDARVVPSLIAALGRSSVYNAAAQELGNRKEPRATPALIAALRKYNNSSSIVEALRDITGQSFGGNPDKWSAWWKAQAARKDK